MTMQTLLSRYTYDPLDRLASRTPLAEAMAQRFYKAGQLVTEVQGSEHRTYLRSDSQLLARKNQSASTLFATDTQNSVLHAEDTAIGYTPYGHHEADTGLPGLPGFNGEQPDPITGHDLLGNGYRAYNPTLMRFNSPDSLSPFGDGGLNAYAYCVGDPVNRSDPTGHIFRDTFILGKQNMRIQPSLDPARSLISRKFANTHTSQNGISVGAKPAPLPNPIEQSVSAVQNGEPSTPKLEGMPIEMMDQITSNFSAMDMESLQLTSKHFREIVGGVANTNAYMAKHFGVSVGALKSLDYGVQLEKVIDLGMGKAIGLTRSAVRRTGISLQDAQRQYGERTGYSISVRHPKSGKFVEFGEVFFER